MNRDLLLRRGDFVKVTYEGRTVDAMVTLASTNGRSLALMFDGMLGGYVGMMPVLDENGTGDFRDLMGSKVELVRLLRS